MMKLSITIRTEAEHETVKKMLEEIGQVVNTPPYKAEIEHSETGYNHICPELKDLFAYYVKARRQGFDHGTVLVNIVHDLKGLVDKDICFCPRTSGYHKQKDGER